MKGIVFFVLIIFCFSRTEAQSFVAEAQVGRVSQNGFYRIQVTPELARYLNRRFTNFRIFDERNKEVPFVFQEEAANQVTHNFREYLILEKEQREGCCTTVLLHNPDQRLSNNINLIIRNADVTKQGSLLGSDDKEHWFALKQQVVLDAVANEKGTSEIKIVDFPLSNYSYYSLRINDSTSAPLNILKAGYFEVREEQGKYQDVPILRTRIAENRKDKTTYLTLKFDTARTIDMLEISMKGAPYFLRRASLYEPRERTLKKGGKQRVNDLLMESEINSGRSTRVELQAIKTKELLLVIENDDNPPLELNFVKAGQLNRYFTTWLEKDRSYSIKIVTSDQQPVYDLSFFRDSIPQNPPEIKVGKVNIQTDASASSSSEIFTTKAYIWVAVIVVIVILGFMSLKLLKENAASENVKD